MLRRPKLPPKGSIMTGTHVRRRFSLAVLAIAAAAAVCAGCSSDSGGIPVSSQAPSQSVAASVSPSAPQSGATGGAGLPAFCGEFSSADLANIASAKDLSSILAAWDKFAADAPAEIKADANTIRDYLHGAVSGSPDPSLAQKVGIAGQHIGVYFAQNCTGG